MDPYKIVYTSQESSDAEIKKAFRKLAAKHHPDKGGDEEKFKQINEAYSTIGTVQKRQEYEALQHAGSFGDFNHNPFGDFGFGDMFDQIFNIGKQQRQPRLKEQTDDDIMFNLKISLAQIKKGVSQKIKFSRNKKCDKCDGVGGKNKNICVSCNGQGIQVIRRGPMIQQMSCPHCRATGFTFEKICDTCSGIGLVKIKESIKLTVDLIS